MAARNAKMALPSYRDIAPGELGGRIARQGFDYQDHIGASFCLDLFECTGLTEVWFEQHDDIVLVWEEGVEIIEMVQVKHEDLPSRYSVATLSHRKTGKGSSMLERSLARSNGREETRFRLVTSYGVASQLDPLTLPLGSAERGLRSDEIDAIRAARHEKLPDAKPAADGTTKDGWVDRCWWDRRPETIRGVQNQNLIRFERMLDALGISVFHDQRDELYFVLLGLVKRKSGPEGASDYKVTRDEVEATLRETIGRQRGGAAGAKNLRHKMEEAGLEDFVEDAVELYSAHRLAELEGRYGRPQDFSEVESEVTAVLSRLKAKLYAGEVPGGHPFHGQCLDALEDVRVGVGKGMMTDAAVQGMMYTRVNRCAHRFAEARP